MKKKRAPDVVRGPQSQSSGRGPRRPTITPAWIDASQTNDAAVRIAAALAKHPVWKAAFVGASPSPKAADLVQRLDLDDEYYYIVTFMKGTRVTARMALAGRSGKLLRCNAISTVDRSLSEFVTPAVVLGPLEGKPFGIGAARQHRVRMAAIGVLPVLSWKPCAESQSPLLPFYVLTVRDSIAYLRVDGKMYNTLNPSPLGR